MFPAHPVSRHRIFRRGRAVILLRQQGLGHIICIGRLGQIVQSPRLHRRHRSGDIAIAGQHDHAGIGAGSMDGLNHRQTASVLKPQIQNRIGRSLDLYGGHGLGNGRYEDGFKAPLF